MDLFIRWAPFAILLLFAWAGAGYAVAGLRTPSADKSRRSNYLVRGLNQVLFIFILWTNLLDANSGMSQSILLHFLLAVEVFIFALIIIGRAREPGYIHPIDLLLFRSPRLASGTTVRRTAILMGSVVAVLALLSILGFAAQPCGWLDRAMLYSGCIRTIGSDHRDLEYLAFSPDGALLASGEKDAVYLWRVDDSSQVRRLDHPGWGQAVAFSPDGALLASGGSDETIRLWRVADGTLLHSFPHTGWVRNVMFSPDGALLAAGGYDPMSLWNVSDGTLVRSWDSQSSGESLVFTPDGQSLIAWGAEGVRFWNVADGNLARQIEMPGASIRSLALSPDGAIIAGLNNDGVVWLVRMADGHVLHKLAITSKEDILLVDKVGFSSDGAVVAATANDGLVWLWQVEDGHAIGTLQQGGSNGGVKGLAFAPQPMLLAAGSNYGAIRLWRIRP